MNARIEIQDVYGNTSGILRADYGKATVAFAAGSRIARTLSGLEFNATEAAKLTAGQSRLQVYVNDLSVGVFLYLGGVEEERAAGVHTTAAPCPDRTYQADQPLAEPFGVDAGDLLTEALEGLYGLAGFSTDDLSLEESTQVCGPVPMLWAPGGPTVLEIANQIHSLLGFLPPHADRSGSIVGRTVPSPELLSPTFVYAKGKGKPDRTVLNVVSDTVKSSTNIAERPNIYIVRSTAPSGAEIAARYQVPASEPHSVESIGYPRAKVVDRPGLASSAQALEVARTEARMDSQVVRTVEATSQPRPEHDLYEIVEWQGERMLEHAWTLPLIGQMSHTWKTVYESG